MKSSLLTGTALVSCKLQRELGLRGKLVLALWQDSISKIFAPRRLVIWAIFSVAISIAGPFGTFDGMAWPLRLAYWAGLIGLSIPVHHAIRTGVERHRTGLNFWVASLGIGLVFAAVFTPMVWMVTKPFADRGMVTLVPFWIMALVNLLGSGIVRSVRGLWHLDALESGRIAAAAAAATATATAAAVREEPEPVPPHRQDPPMPRLLLRLDADKRGNLQHLSVRDHYVVVQTDRGQSTLLMRFADALRELDGIDGMRVHRSHWVARTAVAGMERSSGKLHLRLCDGRLVPVSRSYRDKVEPGAGA